MPQNSGSDFIISVRGKQFVLAYDAELVVGIGEHSFMLSLDYPNRTVYLTDPDTGEKLNLQVKDIVIGDGSGTSIMDKLDVIDVIQDIVDISTTGFGILGENQMITGVKDEILNSNSFLGGTEFEIKDLEPGTVIYKADLIVTTAFTTDPDTQHNIKIVGDNDEIIFDNEWNDPNQVGTYTTSTNYKVGESGKIKIVHDLGEMTAGVAHLKLYTYTPKSE